LLHAVKPCFFLWNKIPDCHFELMDGHKLGCHSLKSFKLADFIESAVLQGACGYTTGAQTSPYISPKDGIL